MALYSPGGESPRRWISQPIAPDGSPASSPKQAADAPKDLSFAVLRSNDAAGVFVGVWTGEGAASQSLQAVVLRADGTPVRDPIAIVDGVRPVLWAEAIPVRDGFITLWAEQNKGRARLLARKLSATGTLDSEVSVVEEEALAWQAEAIPSGAAVAVTRAGTDATSLGRVALRLVGADARPTGEAIALTDQPTAQLDVDLARVGDSLQIAWTDRRETDSRVWIAVTDLKGALRGPAHGVLPPRGDQALIDLVPPANPTSAKSLLIIDELPHAQQESSDASLALIDEQGAAVGITSHLTVAADSLADLAATGVPNGFIVLSRSRDCSAAEDTSEPLFVPWFLRFGADQAVAVGSPLRLVKGPNGTPPAAWAPGCIGSACYAIGADTGNPATVVTIRLQDRPAGCALPLRPSTDAHGARLVLTRAVHSSEEPMSGVAGTNLGSSSLVAWVTHHVTAPGTPERKAPPGTPGDPSKPLEAEVGVRAFAASGEPVAAHAIVSLRAYSAGGVALSPGGTPTSEACLAWVARDNGDPQVFLTKIGQDGSRKAQRMLTRAKGDASDVAIERVKNGWVVAWVDGRDGNGEVYAMRVDDLLRPAGPEVRVTNAPGDASEVSLVAVGNDVIATYSDARAAPDGGVGNPYFRRLNATTLAPVGEERRLARSQLHARAPKLVRVGDGLIAFWLEVGVPGASADSQDHPGVHIVQIEPASGQAMFAPTIMVPERGEATGFTVQCDDARCTGTMSADSGTSPQLLMFTWSPITKSATVAHIANLGGPPGMDVAAAVLGTTLFYGDVGVAGDNRLRRATVQWDDR